MSEENVQQAPSKEELIKFFQEQIDVKKVQLELQRINADMAKARAEELQALQFIANMTNPQPAPNQSIHKITQEDLDANPELEAAGLSVGDEVMIPNNQEEVIDKKPRKLKKENA